MDAHAVKALVDTFNAAWANHDLDAAIALLSDDCLFESTAPAPDGEAHRGRDAVRAAWAPIFADASAQFTSEEAFVADDRLVQMWRYDWDGGHVRGIDVIRVRDDKISAKLSYVKG